MAQPLTKPIRLTGEGANPTSPFDPITLQDGRTIEWHVAMDEMERMFKLELRYAKDIELPGVAILQVGAGNAVQVEKTVFLPSVPEHQIKADAREVLSNEGVRAFLKDNVSEAFLASVDAFLIKL